MLACGLVGWGLVGWWRGVQEMDRWEVFETFVESGHERIRPDDEGCDQVRPGEEHRDRPSSTFRPSRPHNQQSEFSLL